MQILHILFILLLLPVVLRAGIANPLTVADVTLILQQSVAVAQQTDPAAVVAVTDREGFVLTVYGLNHLPTASEVAVAVSKAGTAGFLSSNQEAFTSRTAGFIIQDHFPPTIDNTPPGPLVGVGLSSLTFSDGNHFRTSDATPVRIDNTHLSGTPGGVPLYKDGILVGGVGVVNTNDLTDGYIAEGYADEAVAVAAQTGFGPSGGILATNVFINGFRLPYVISTAAPGALGTLNPAYYYYAYQIAASTGNPPQTGTPLGTPTTTTLNGITGEVRDPIINSPYLGTVNATINGQARLNAGEVASILSLSAQRALITRAGIRLPVGVSAAVFIAVVDNPNHAGDAPTVLGSFRTQDATIFSYDVAIQKARTALFFSTNSLAMSSRTVGFLAQDMFPPGIDGNPPGPFYGLQNTFSFPDAGTTPPNANLPNGITIFPGGFPLYRNGQLIGAIGVSGDGVDQDDIISASGTVNFLAPDGIRADQFTFRGARLPYAKFPRDPSR